MGFEREAAAEAPFAGADEGQGHAAAVVGGDGEGARCIAFVAVDAGRPLVHPEPGQAKESGPKIGLVPAFPLAQEAPGTAVVGLGAKYAQPGGIVGLDIQPDVGAGGLVVAVALGETKVQ